MNSKHPHFGKARKDKNRIWIGLLDHVSDDGGLYCVWKGEEVVYIGQAKYLRNRLTNHNLKDIFTMIEVDRVTIIVTHLNKPRKMSVYASRKLEDKNRRERLNMEKWLINLHNPKLNGTDKFAACGIALVPKVAA